MSFTAPIPFRAAVQKLADKGVMPTDLSSDELRALDSAVRDRAFFSARTTNASYLQDLRKFWFARLPSAQQFEGFKAPDGFLRTRPSLLTPRQALVIRPTTKLQRLQEFGPLGF